MTKGKTWISIRLDSRIVKALDDELNKIDKIFYPNRSQVMEKYLWKGIFGNRKQKSR